MNTLLLLLIIFGLGAIIISIHVFAEGARNYDIEPGTGSSKGNNSVEFQERNPVTRRIDTSAGFPLSIDGIVIHEDRRNVPDRRQLAA